MLPHYFIERHSKRWVPQFESLTKNMQRGNEFTQKCKIGPKKMFAPEINSRTGG